MAPGAVVRRRMIPVNRVGLYVPGGLAPLASSVIMNVVPAKVAGVPPSRSPRRRIEFGGMPHPNILALCHILGVDEVYAVGGAQAIAMFAYGVPGLCRQVDLITGPGNIYVVAAKRLPGAASASTPKQGRPRSRCSRMRQRIRSMWPRTSSPGRARSARGRGVDHGFDELAEGTQAELSAKCLRRSMWNVSSNHWQVASPPS